MAMCCFLAVLERRLINMRRVFPVVIVALVLTGCAHSRVINTAGADPAAVVRQFVGAFNDLDIEHARQLFAEDATAYLPFAATGARVNGRDAIIAALAPLFESELKRLSPGAPPYLHLTANDIKVQRLSENAAILSFDVGNEKVFSRRTLVVRQSANGWVIVHLHASNLRPQ